MAITTNHRPDGNGKGDKPRPINDRQQFEKNWDAIFKKKEQDEYPRPRRHKRDSEGDK
jgi:hypothetical protein